MAARARDVYGESVLPVPVFTRALMSLMIGLDAGYREMRRAWRNLSIPVPPTSHRGPSESDDPA